MNYILLSLIIILPTLINGQNRSVGKRSQEEDVTITHLPKRVALVIGNGTYLHSMPLKTPANDASEMTEMLQKLGFEVSRTLNADLSEMTKSINDWTQKLGNNDIALFYFAGHGAEIDGENFLFPIDANPKNKADVAFEAYPVSRVLGKLATTKVLTNIILLDACRNNPFIQRWSQIIGDVGGLANMSAPKGTFIGFAARPGEIASDGNRVKSLYTEAILKTIQLPNLTIDQIFNQVNKYVRSVSEGNQMPFKSSSLEDDFYFSKTSNGKDSKPMPIISEEGLTKPTTRKFMDLPFAEAIYVAGGTFEMGNNDGADDVKPVHKVTVSDFYMGKYEITVAQFRAFIESTNFKTEAENVNESTIYFKDTISGYVAIKTAINWRHDPVGNLRPSSEDNHPVLHVSWNDATNFCEWLSKKENRKYRLPTEAEWEYVAGNGATHSKFSWGNSDPNKHNGGNICDVTLKKKFPEFFKSVKMKEYADGYALTAPVGSYAANVLGLYDMSGNVWEWCIDFYGYDYYSQSSTGNPVYLYPTKSIDASRHVSRGGSWRNDWWTNTYRLHLEPKYSSGEVGFRVVSPIN